MGTTTIATKAPSWTGAFAVRGTAVGYDLGTESYAVDGLMAHTGAPIRGTGLPVGVQLRLRAFGAEAALRGQADATDVQLNSDTPGDLPPRDPLS